MALRLRRGTDAERQTITPLEGELIYTTDTKELYVGDGSTAGGLLVSADLLDDTTPTLGGDLNLNGNNITGTGNINIDGTISATGNINLGDGAEDNIIVGGQISSNLIPKSNDIYDLGSALSTWSNVYTSGLEVTTTASISNLSITESIYGSDSSIIYDSATDTLSATNIVGNVTGNFTGSVFADNSTRIIDAIDGSGTFTSIDTASLTITESSYISTQATPGILNDVHRFGALGTPNSLVVFTDTRIIEANGFGNEPDLSPDIEVFKARGTWDSPVAVASGDDTAKYISYAYDGSAYDTVAGFQIRVNDTVTTGNIPGEFNILVGNLINAPDDLKLFSFKGDGTLTLPGPVIGDLTGSVFADDSTLLVDGVNGEIPGYVKVADLKTALQDGAGDYAAFKAWVLANL